MTGSRAGAGNLNIGRSGLLVGIDGLRVIQRYYPANWLVTILREQGGQFFLWLVRASNSVCKWPN